ncbi:MAG: efflux RND transporter periplasmic adaptor subunit [Proteobacteria bacterium]|nr:efflux RND transporter periplasmic adaptor subunit [Pseudomonadota bacterium]
MIRRSLSLAALCGLLAACGGKSTEPAGAAAPAAAASAASGAAAPAAAAAASGPPVSVSVVRAQRRDVAVQVEATGTVAALATVDIKPQISSVVTAVHVKDGQFVTKGQLLFTLDGRADAANLAKAEAQTLRDQATLADAQRQLARARDLVAQGFVSQGAVDTAQSTVDAQRALVVADRAAADAARVTVSYSRIAAPSSGRVGQIAVFAGSSVAPGGAAMVSITQLDPISVSFNLPQRNLPDALKALAEAGRGALPAAVPASGVASAALPVVLPPGQVLALLPDARGQRIGRLDFVDSLVDPASGTVKVKALFANKDQALWPGAYVNVSLSLQALPGAVVVPQAAIVQGARGHSLFVIDEQGLAASRPVKLLQALGSDAAVSGVKPGEKVVLDGRQNLRPGSRVVERAAEGASGGGRGGRRGGGASAPGDGASAPAAAASRAPSP